MGAGVECTVSDKNRQAALQLYATSMATSAYACGASAYSATPGALSDAKSAFPSAYPHTHAAVFLLQLSSGNPRPGLPAMC